MRQIILYKLNDKVIMITGSTSGLGLYMANELAGYKANLLLHGRNEEKLLKIIREIQIKTGNRNIHPCIAYFSSLKDVDKMASEILKTDIKLHVLINNAGIGGGTPSSGREESKDGYELRFAVNYLATYHLTNKLLPLLLKSTPARIVNVSSAGQRAIDFSDVMLEKNYEKYQAYTQSKLAMIMMTIDLAKELKEKGVTVNALHPATYMDTFMVRESSIKPINSIKAGADPTIRLALSEKLEGITGKYFNQDRESKANTQAYDVNSRKTLKQLSKNLIAQSLTK